MKTFISVLALAAIAAAETTEAAWKENEACQPYQAKLLIKFANAIQSDNLAPVQKDVTEAGEVDWTQKQKDDFDAQKLALITLVNKETGAELNTIDGQTTVDQLGDSNAKAFLSLLDQESGIEWTPTKEAWIADNSTDFVPKAEEGQDAPTGTYEEICNAPVVEDVEITVEAKNWGLTHEKAAWEGARELKAQAEDGNGVKVPNEFTQYATIEGRSGWKVTGGGSDSTNTMQFAWELNMKEDGEEFTTLAFMWADSDDAANAEFSRFEFNTFPNAKGQLFLNYQWAQKAPKTEVPSVVVNDDDEDAGARRFLTDDEVVNAGEEEKTGEEVTEEAKPKIDFEKSWFDQTWTDTFTMKWTKKTEGAAYEPKALTTRAPSSFWQIDQRLTKFVAGWGEEDVFENMTVRVNMMQQQGDNAALTNVKEGGSAHLWIGLVQAGADEFACDAGDPVAVEWAAVEKPDDNEPENGDEDNTEETGDEEGGEVTTGGDGEETKDGATSVTAFGVAIMAAISALAF